MSLAIGVAGIGVTDTETASVDRPLKAGRATDVSRERGRGGVVWCRRGVNADSPTRFASVFRELTRFLTTLL
jgi:hypothetical protein